MTMAYPRVMPTFRPASSGKCLDERCENMPVKPSALFCEEWNPANRKFEWRAIDVLVCDEHDEASRRQ